MTFGFYPEPPVVEMETPRIPELSMVTKLVEPGAAPGKVIAYPPERLEGASKAMKLPLGVGYEPGYRRM